MGRLRLDLRHGRAEKCSGCDSESPTTRRRFPLPRPFGDNSGLRPPVIATAYATRSGNKGLRDLAVPRKRCEVCAVMVAWAFACVMMNRNGCRVCSPGEPSPLPPKDLPVTAGTGHTIQPRRHQLCGCPEIVGCSVHQAHSVLAHQLSQPRQLVEGKRPRSGVSVLRRSCAARGSLFVRCR